MGWELGVYYPAGWCGNRVLALGLKFFGLKGLRSKPFISGFVCLVHVSESKRKRNWVDDGAGWDTEFYLQTGLGLQG